MQHTTYSIPRALYYVLYHAPYHVPYTTCITLLVDISGGRYPVLIKVDAQHGVMHLNLIIYRDQYQIPDDPPPGSLATPPKSRGGGTSRLLATNARHTG